MGWEGGKCIIAITRVLAFSLGDKIPCSATIAVVVGFVRVESLRRTEGWCLGIYCWVSYGRVWYEISYGYGSGRVKAESTHLMVEMV